MKCSCNLSINRFQCDSQPQSSSYVFSKEHSVHAFLNLFCGPCLTKDNRGFTGNQTGPICRYLIYYRSDALTQEPGGCVERVLVSRQPIYRTDMAVFGYELLFRDSEINRASFSDGDQATAEVILNTFMEIGLQEVVGQRLAFINFGRNLIMANYCESLPSERVVIELLESVEPDDAVVKRLAQLKSAGYHIALDDFICADPFYRLLESAHFVKLDVLACDQEMIERSVATLKKFPVQLIAEKVETREQFQFCQTSGFDYFQGYFFCRPELVSSQRLPVNRLATIRLITKLNNPDIKFKELEESLSQDVSLSYKLLRYVNSAVCGLNHEVESMRHAVVL